LDAVTPSLTVRREARREDQVKPPTFAAWMVAAVIGVAAIAYVDAAREDAAALKDFAEEPRSVARAIASLQREDEPDPRAEGALTVLRAVETPGLQRVFVRRHDDAELTATDGSRVAAGSLTHGLESAQPSVRLTRAEAASLGLPARSAIAGLASFDWHGLPYEVVVVTSAARERDRDLRAQRRLVLSIILGAGLVLGFGVGALRRQRRQLELGHELAVAEVARERDERLVAADKLATLGALATGIAHEISTPLGVIVARADTIATADGVDAKSKRAASIILEQSDRITATIRGFLGLARGRTPELVNGVPARLAEQAVALTEHRFQQGGVEVKLEVEDDLPRVACDALLFEHVLVNLLLNACDAAGPGGHVELRVTREDSNVAFVVVDDGPGISKAAAARALEPFFTTKPEDKGTGLGLAIANEIVKHHNGRLAIGPRTGERGTKALAILPAVAEGGIDG
jgi:two-component system NtrC family sensor kinase